MDYRNFNYGNMDISKFETGTKEHLENKKIKKFFKTAAPILILEVVAIIGLVVYLLLLPKNYCKIHTNNSQVEVLVNNQKTNKFMFDEPEGNLKVYYYSVDISLDLPDAGKYEIKFKIDCKKYMVQVNSKATANNGEYVMVTDGYSKVQLLDAIIIKSDSEIKNFDIDIYVNVAKI